MSNNIPILFIVFNRPTITKKVFAEIKRYKPKKLFIAADGPRRDKEGERERCNEVRRIVEKIGWNCDVNRLYRNNNLGCKKSVSSAINWFFNNVEEGIILEDDCLPDVSFFKFCSDLLKKYRRNPKIMHIGSNNFQDGITRGNGSYYFSKYSHIWGWATWRRAWKKYKIDIKINDDKDKKTVRKKYSGFLERVYWESLFWCVSNNLLNTWDLQWLYSIWLNNGICISPNKNLVINLGFGKSSTHTKMANNTIRRVKLEHMGKIVHPKVISISFDADQYTLRNAFGVSLKNLWRILSIIPYNIYKNI